MTTQGPDWGNPGPGLGPAPPPQYYYPGGVAPPQTEGMAIAGLVLAIVSYFLLGPISAVVALVLARSSNKKIRESGGRLTGESLNKATVIVAWINIALCALILLLVIVFLIIATAASTA
jgi:hypothetical protein